MNILIYPAGTEIGLEIARSLRHQKRINVFAANSEDDFSKFVHDKVHFCPSIYDGAEDVLRQLVIDLAIDYIYPAHDEVVYRLSQTDLPILSSPVETVNVCRFKSNTYKLFPEYSPKVFSPDNKKGAILFPVFCKPDNGQGSRGTWKAENFTQLVEKWNGELILEYLTGKEYTIDCFTDKTGELTMHQRERVTVKNGISVEGARVNISDLKKMGESINCALEFRGAWFFQAKEHNGKIYLMEIAPRPAGCSCLTRVSGYNMPLLTVYDRMTDVQLIPTPGISRVRRSLQSKYVFTHKFREVNIDLDDTLCPEIIGLLLRLKAAGKKLNLITRNQYPSDALRSMHIVPTLFDRIIIAELPKSHYIKGGIFIDDSFAERKEVYDAKGIPCFDVQQAIEVL